METAEKLARFVAQVGPEIEQFSIENSTDNPDLWYVPWTPPHPTCCEQAGWGPSSAEPGLEPASVRVNLHLDDQEKPRPLFHPSSQKDKGLGTPAAFVCVPHKLSDKNLKTSPEQPQLLRELHLWWKASMMEMLLHSSRGRVRPPDFHCTHVFPGLSPALLCFLLLAGELCHGMAENAIECVLGARGVALSLVLQ